MYNENLNQISKIIIKKILKLGKEKLISQNKYKISKVVVWFYSLLLTVNKEQGQ